MNGEYITCCCSVTKSCPRLCNPMDCSTPGFPILHYLLSLLKLMSRSRWCHPAISSSVVLFFYCPQSFPASGSFPMSQFFTSGGQSIGASASVLAINIQYRFPSGWTGWISLQSKGLSRVFAITIVWKYLFFDSHPSLWSNSHIHTWLLEKAVLLEIALTVWTFVGKVMFLLFNTLSRFVLAFLPKSKHLLISWLQSLFAVILKP